MPTRSHSAMRGALAEREGEEMKETERAHGGAAAGTPASPRIPMWAMRAEGKREVERPER